LFDVHAAAEPLELIGVLVAPFVDVVRPDFCRDDGIVATTGERDAERTFCAAVHRRRVNETNA